MVDAQSTGGWKDEMKLDDKRGMMRRMTDTRRVDDSLSRSLTI
jgi:hypothetical protein